MRLVHSNVKQVMETNQGASGRGREAESQSSTTNNRLERNMQGKRTMLQPRDAAQLEDTCRTIYEM